MSTHSQPDKSPTFFSQDVTGPDGHTTHTGSGMTLDEFKKVLLPYLISGGAGAAAGAVMTGGRRKGSGESRLGHLGRILGNALITGGVAGGGHWLLNKGMQSTVGSTGDPSDELALKEQSPAARLAENVAFSPLTAGVAGIAGLSATADNKLLGSGSAKTKDVLDVIAKKTGTSAGELNVMTPSAIDELLAKAEAGAIPAARGGGLMKAEHILDSTRQAAGLPSALGGGLLAGKYKGAISNALHRNPLLETFGHTMPRRIMRGGLGLAAAGIPALIGTLLPEKTAA